MTRYGFRVTDSVVPQVEITRDNRWQGVVVTKRVYGFTHGHAIARALRWMRAHGDPR